MFQTIKNKIEHLRQQPEEVRFRAAIRYTVIGGIIVAVLWLGVLLPLQLHNIF